MSLFQRGPEQVRESTSCPLFPPGLPLETRTRLFIKQRVSWTPLVILFDCFSDLDFSARSIKLTCVQKIAPVSTVIGATGTHLPKMGGSLQAGAEVSFARVREPYKGGRWRGESQGQLVEFFWSQFPTLHFLPKFVKYYLNSPINWDKDWIFILKTKHLKSYNFYRCEPYLCSKQVPTHPCTYMEN